MNYATVRTLKNAIGMIDLAMSKIKAPLPANLRAAISEAIQITGWPEEPWPNDNDTARLAYFAALIARQSGAPDPHPTTADDALGEAVEAALKVPGADPLTVLRRALDDAIAAQQPDPVDAAHDRLSELLEGQGSATNIREAAVALCLALNGRKA